MTGRLTWRDLAAALACVLLWERASRALQAGRLLSNLGVSVSIARVIWVWKGVCLGKRMFKSLVAPQPRIACAGQVIKYTFAIT
jgi:hypothetical protein